jgi:hypothetical protein
LSNPPEVLFLGEGPRANYVEGALRTAFRVSRVYASQALAGTDVEPRLRDSNLNVLSDYPAQHLTSAHQHTLAAAVERDGHELLMIGGWAGGILDWGQQRITLPTGNEVGHLYMAFLVDLCRWLARLT